MQTHSPFQPLPDKFVPQTLRAFARFLLFHPLLVVLSCLLAIAPRVFLSAAPVVPDAYTGFLAIPYHMLLTSIIATFAGKYLTASENQDSLLNFLKTASTVISIIRTHYNDPESPLRWSHDIPSLLKVCLPLSVLFHLFRNAQPSPVFTFPFNYVLADALLFVLLLALGGAAFFCSLPIQATHLYNFKKTGSFLFYAMLLPVLKDPSLTPTTKDEIARLNSTKTLANLFILWMVVRTPLSFIGANPLVDAFAFSALIHASLGGSLATKPAASSRTNAHPQPSH